MSTETNRPVVEEANGVLTHDLTYATPYGKEYAKEIFENAVKEDKE